MQKTKGKYMAHPDQFKFVSLVKKHLPFFFEGTKVLEVGSLDINGSVRSAFQAEAYIGVDVAPGNGVDVVCEGQLLDCATAAFDVVISCECLEHNPFWVETVSNMVRMTRPGGLVVISCASIGRAEHGTSRTSVDDSPLSVSKGWEYYKNISASNFMRTFSLKNSFDDYVILTNWNNFDLYFVGIRKSESPKLGLHELRQDLIANFSPLTNFRTITVAITAKLFGEPGVGILRFMRRLVRNGHR